MIRLLVDRREERAIFLRSTCRPLAFQRPWTTIHGLSMRLRHYLVARAIDWAKFRAMKETASRDIRTLRQEVEGLGATLYWRGSQWFLCGRETEPLGYSIKTEREALQFVLDRARERLRTR
jgi:hypothetical protein